MGIHKKKIQPDILGYLYLSAIIKNYSIIADNYLMKH